VGESRGSIPQWWKPTSTIPPTWLARVANNPSDFLTGGLEQIYARANEVFEDLMDISTAVVLFDEMDALVQKRGDDLDVTRQLLTTSMLPKLAGLHDQAKLIFLMATNHRKGLDEAITRPGRFDLQICVGPPSWSQKLAGVSQVLEGLQAGDLSEVKEELEKLGQSAHTREHFDHFTVAELRNFLRQIQRSKQANTWVAALKTMRKEEFEATAADWAHCRQPHVLPASAVLGVTPPCAL
jgi:SpoVK/Ycf46/Vps4 family AAA+-type ATPase